jgi:ribosomal protein L7/L12
MVVDRNGKRSLVAFKRGESVMKIESREVAIFDGGREIVLAKMITEASRELYRLQSRVAAIKLTRSYYDLGLKDAKDLCDFLGEYTGGY